MMVAEMGLGSEVVVLVTEAVSVMSTQREPACAAEVRVTAAADWRVNMKLARRRTSKAVEQSLDLDQSQPSRHTIKQLPEYSTTRLRPLANQPSLL